jgi:hypothetical protein
MECIFCLVQVLTFLARRGPPFDLGGRGGEKIADGKVFGTKFIHHPAAIENEGAVADFGDFLEVRGNDHDRRSTLQCQIEQSIDLGLGTHVDARGRILED